MNEFTEQERATMRGIVQELGTNRASAALNTSPPTLCRAIAGLPMARMTYAHLRHGLAAYNDSGER